MERNDRFYSTYRYVKCSSCKNCSSIEFFTFNALNQWRPHMFGPVCQRCESTDADSLKTIVLQQQDDALLDLVGLCRVWRVTQSSRGCASWLGVRALSSSPTPLARYRTCVQVWRRCSILGEVSVQCSRWLSIAKRGCALSRAQNLFPALLT